MKEAKIADELRLLSDEPAQVDEIGCFAALAKTLTSILISDIPRPFVLGLFGPWGSGKSSVVEMLLAEKTLPFKVVVVDAWKKDKDNFLRQFVKRIARELLNATECAAVTKELNFRISEQTSEWKPTGKAFVAILAYLAVLVAIAGGLFIGWSRNEKFPVTMLGAYGLAAAAVIFVQWLLPLFSRQIQTKLEQISLEDPAWFRTVYFERILGRTRYKAVCIVIDNLDRVPADDALAIIRTIKTFLVANAHPGRSDRVQIAFLVPCDDNELIKTVQSSNVTDGREFLHKFFNVTVRMPNLLHQDHFAYVRKLVEQTGLPDHDDVLDRVAFVIAQGSGSNPRRPKVLLNHFASRFNLMLNFPAVAEIVRKHPDWLAIYSVLEASGNDRLPTEIEFVKQLSGGVSTGDFVSSVTGILDEIPPAVWASFRSLKEPTVHDLIPNYRALFASAVALQFDEFIRLLKTVGPNKKTVLRYLWSERSDYLTRMNVSISALRAVERGAITELPPQIISTAAQNISKQTSGWVQYPPEVAFDYVLKDRKDDLRNLFSASNNLKGEHHRDEQAFLKVFATRYLKSSPDFAYMGDVLRATTQCLIEADEGFSVIACQYPALINDTVVSAIIRQWSASPTTIKAEKLVDVISLIHAINTKSDFFQNVMVIMNKKFDGMAEDCRAAAQFAYCLAKQIRLKVVHSPLNVALFFDFLKKGYAPIRRTSPEDAWLVVGAIAELAEAETEVRNAARDEAAGLFRDFLWTGAGGSIIYLLGIYHELIEAIAFDAALKAARLEGYRAIAVFRHFLNQRTALFRDLESHAISQMDELLAWIVATDRDSLWDVVEILLTLAGETPESLHLYQSIGFLRTSATEPPVVREHWRFNEVFAQHFENRCKQSDLLTVFANLEQLLKSMELSGYKPTPDQKQLLHSAKDKIDVATLTDDQRKLVKTILGKN